MARRREENLQQVPTAVTAIGARDLADLHINNFGAVGVTVPNLNVQTQFGSGSIAQYALRGQDSGTLSFEADSRIGLYLDGVYLARPSAAVFDLADVCRLEVLRGPQGTLFGRNATGGAINFITCDPSRGIRGRRRSRALELRRTPRASHGRHRVVSADSQGGSPTCTTSTTGTSTTARPAP